MPRRRFAKRKPMRRKTLRKRGKKIYKNKSSLSRVVAKFPGKNPLPRKYVCKLTYSDIVNINGSGVFRSVDRVFSHNSIFDPDVTGTGHQPRYYDQLAGIYDFYRVLGCKIKVNYIPTDATAPQQNHYMCVIPSNDPSNLNNQNYLNLSELPYSKVVVNNLYGQRSRIQSYHSVSRVAGVNSSTVKNDDAFRSQVALNPATRTFWHVVCGTLDEANLSISGRLVVDITYYVQFENPLTPSAS